MKNRYTAVLLSFTLAITFAFGLFLEPSESQANPGTGWKGEYFNNNSLSGSPVVVVYDDQILMNWAEGQPFGNIPADFFSVRWTATVNFEAGIYHFRTGADDGIRMWIDDTIIIDEWSPAPFHTSSVNVRLAGGPHNLRVEYFENEGLAGVLVDWYLIEAAVPAISREGELTYQYESEYEANQPKVHVATGNLNVRANPSVNAARLTQVHLYESYPLLGVTSDGAWYLIQLRDGRTGWVSARYSYRNDQMAVPIFEVEASTESTAPDIQVTGMVSVELKIRVSPRTGDQIGVVPRNGTIRVLARNISGSWFYIRWEGEGYPLEGWVYSPYVQLTNGKVMDLPVQ